MQHTNASKSTRFPSLVDTLSRGFAAVNRRPWVVLIPLLLDVIYWAGPRLSYQPLLDQFAALTRALNPEAWALLEDQASNPFSVPSSPVDLSPLSGFSAVGIPKFLNILGPLLQTEPILFAPTTWYIGSIPAMLGALLVMNVLTLLLLSVYLFVLGNATQTRAASLSLKQRWLRTIGSITVISLIFVGVWLLAMIPFGLMAGFALLANQALGQLIVALGVVLLLWLLFTASFAFDAVVVSDAGPVRALLSSLYVVQRSFWSAFGLLLLGWLIILGMSIVWQLLASSVLGLLIAMIGSAYISSGLAAAHLLFYRDRFGGLAKRM